MFGYGELAGGLTPDWLSAKQADELRTDLTKRCGAAVARGAVLCVWSCMARLPWLSLYEFGIAVLTQLSPSRSLFAPTAKPAPPLLAPSPNQVRLQPFATVAKPNSIPPGSIPTPRAVIDDEMHQLREDLRVMRTEVLRTGDSKLNIPVQVRGGKGGGAAGKGRGGGGGARPGRGAQARGRGRRGSGCAAAPQGTPGPPGRSVRCATRQPPQNTATRPPTSPLPTLLRRLWYQMERLVWTAQTKFDCGPSKPPKPGDLGPLEIVEAVKALADKLVGGFPCLNVLCTHTLRSTHMHT